MINSTSKKKKLDSDTAVGIALTPALIWGVVNITITPFGIFEFFPKYGLGAGMFNWSMTGLLVIFSTLVIYLCAWVPIEKYFCVEVRSE